MKIEWAPVKIPFRRRLQTLASSLHIFSFFLMPFVAIFITSWLLLYANYWLRALTLVYLTYVFYDQKYNNSVIDGNGVLFFRNNFIWRNLRDYFPVELIKTADLTPNRNYIIASFPHGIICTGITINMGFDFSRFLELYPGIRPKLATLDVHFWIPFSREILRSWGLVSVSKKSLSFYLRKSNDPNDPYNHDGFTSNAVGILIGGAQEALDSHPGRYKITLRNRKGFVKLAISTGSAIVPSFSFGEVDAFNQVYSSPDSMLRRFQSVFKKLTTISPIIFNGRGFFQYTFGFLPRRKRIVQVLGAPILVEKNERPDPKYVDEIHQKVMDALEDLFETYKFKYIENVENTKLVIQ